MAHLVSEILAASLDDLMVEARALRQRRLVTYSPKVFIPLTTLCRDVCGYCTFARPPRRGERAYLPIDEVLAIARAGAEAGCTEALFTLGDKPERRYRVARDELAALGCASTIEYLAQCARTVLDETGLLPHLNPGVMTREELDLLRPVSASMGIMLETVADRLSEKGGPHWASPDKVPAARLETIRLAGEAAIPFTSGILVGIGETRAERLDALLALRLARGRVRASRRGDHPELPGQARDQDGRPRRRRVRGPAVDGCGGARPPRARTGMSRRRRISPTTTSRGSSTPESTTGAACRR